jgi:hypothetical protein
MTEVLRLQADPETGTEESPGGVPFVTTASAADCAPLPV